MDPIDLIRTEVMKANRPIVMSSFGKDSMVLLDLVDRAGFKLPILFLREPFFPEKYEFANKIIQDRGYSVYDYPPLRTGVIRKNGQIEIANFYQVGAEEETIFLPTGVIEPKIGERFLCGLKDLVYKPTGTFNFPWDVILIGHKSSDIDPVQGSVPLSDYAVDSGPVRVVFPLRDFTDEDIWKYTAEHSVPVHGKRYQDGKELDDKTFNPDYFPTCTRCFTEESSEVYCPLMDRDIPNNSGLVDFVEVTLPNYVEKH